MKKLLIALLFIPVMLCGQITGKQRPVIYLSYLPTGHGIGLKYDHFISNSVGVYGSVSYGAFGLYKLAGYDGHFKATLGSLMPIQEKMNSSLNLMAAVNYHYVYGDGIPEQFPDVFKHHLIERPWSLEFGFTLVLRRMAVGVRTDVIRWEPCIDIGIPIGPKPASTSRACLIPFDRGKSSYQPKFKKFRH